MNKENEGVNGDEDSHILSEIKAVQDMLLPVVPFNTFGILHPAFKSITTSLTHPD